MKATAPFTLLFALLLAACNNASEEANHAGHDPNAADHPEDCPNCSHEALGVEVVELFNGENLEGWSSVLWSEDGSAESLSKEDVWSVEDGVLICKGKPLGYLQTTEDYQDYVLNLEWRWAPGTTPTNSGVLLRIAEAPETFLPKCVEAQLQHGNAGDLYGFFGASLEGDSERYQLIESEKIGDFHAVKKMKSLEKSPGEWNHYRIKVHGDTIKLHINGELANEGHGIDVLAGPIGLQSEGSEIHFRNVRVEPLEPLE
ncbi:MAG: DUF1080 domain-containing protein [Akkermansiaceae bacterium]|nr:DUF1080 domain-containing protein [Akkermansiaceae bacterium]